MQLSTRLKMVADCVSKGSIVADVGCDHAYISIYLMEHNLAQHIIALDINKGPLQRAKENIKQYGLEEKIQTRLSNGLLKLKPKEADCIVIAGMGGELMKNILIEGAACVAQAKELILQPQSEIYKIRRYLHTIGFNIIFENMCIDDGKFYVVIKAVPSQFDSKPIESRNLIDLNEKQNWEEIENQEKITVTKKATRSEEITIQEEYGLYLIEQKHPILKEYLLYLLHTNKEILKKLEEHPTEKTMLRKIQCKEEQKRIRETLKRVL